MADDTGTTAPPATAPATGADTPSADLGDAGKQAIDRMKAERDAAVREAKANAGAAKRLAELEESQKTEAQKLADRTSEAERRAQAAATDLLRYEVALEKGLTKTQAKRLLGTTAEELAADADELLASFEKTPTKPAGDADQGARSTASKPDMNAALRAAFSR